MQATTGDEFTRDQTVREVKRAKLSRYSSWILGPAGSRLPRELSRHRPDLPSDSGSLSLVDVLVYGKRFEAGKRMHIVEIEFDALRRMLTGCSSPAPEGQSRCE